MIFPVVKRLTNPAWIQFFQKLFFLPTLVLTHSNASKFHKS